MSKTKKSEQFPQALFVTREYPQSEDPFLVAHESLDSTAEIGEVVDVAVYRLVSVKKVRTEIKAD